METQEQEQLTTTAKETGKQDSSELIERVAIKDTPFVGIKENGKWFGTFGKYKITEEYNTYAAMEKEIKAKSWNKLITIMSIVCENLIQYNEKEVK